MMLRSMRTWSFATLAAALMCLSFLQLGCGPDYPKCDNSEDCRSSDKGKKEGRLICVRSPEQANIGMTDAEAAAQGST